MSNNDSSIDRKSRKKKRKVNWSEYNESLVKRGELLFDTGFFSELASRIKGNEQGKGRGKISLSEFLDIAARHRTRLPATIQAAGRISESDVSAHTRVEREKYHIIQQCGGVG